MFVAPRARRRVPVLLLDRVFWQTDVAREDVGAAGGHDRKVGNGGAGFVVEEAVDDLVDGAVTTGGDDQLDAIGPRPPAELDRMAAMVGLGDLDLEVVPQASSTSRTHCDIVVA